MRAGKLSGIINYRKISEGNNEFRRSDYWLLEIEPPKGIYFPGNELLQIRTQSFTTGINDAPNILSKTIRQYTVKQGARTESTAGTMNLTVQDRVDQTIAYFIDSWKQGIGRREKLSGLPKDLYISPLIRATYFDINENKIRTIEFYQCMISDGGLPEDGGESSELEDAVSLAIDYEHFERIFENVNV